MSERIITIFNTLTALIVGLNVAVFFALFTDIESVVVDNFSIVQAVKYYLFMINYALQIFGYALGALVFVAGVRLLIIHRGASNLGLILVGITIILPALYLLERWGLIFGAPFVS